MSGEAFQTVLSCDMRTAPDGQSIEYAEAGTRQPRWLDWNGTFNRNSNERPWATCYLYAENATRIAADAVRSQPMSGITGDHPERRETAANLLTATADLVRLLALDHAYDGELTDERWAERIAAVQSALDEAHALHVSED